MQLQRCADRVSEQVRRRDCGQDPEGRMSQPGRPQTGQIGIVTPDWPSNSEQAHLVGWEVQGKSIRLAEKFRTVPSDWPHDSEQMQLIG